jgi:hypothetical protein
MPKTKISEFNANPALNTDIDSINIAEGCAPSGINDAIRELMAQLKDFQTGAVGDSFNGPIGSTTASTGAFTTLTTTGTINNLTVGRGAGAVSTNTAVGVSALAANTTGGGNSAYGDSALLSNTTGAQNAAFSGDSLGANTTGSYNVAVGKQALRYNTTASNNTAVGYQAGYSNTTGSVTALGRLSLYSNTTGTDNSALGNSSLYANTTGNANTGIGYQALNSNTTASSNTAVGYQAGYSFTAPSAGTEGNCTFIGRVAGYSVTTGYNNTFIGQSAGYNVTTGIKNTILGTYNGNQGGLDIRTSDSNVILSDGDGHPSAYSRLISNGVNWYVNAKSGNRYIGIEFDIATAYKAQLYYDNTAAAFFVQNSGGGVYLSTNATSWAAVSDERLKENLVPIANGLSKVCSLRSVIGNYISDESKKPTPFLIAQDVQAVLPEAVTISTQKDSDTEYLGVAYSEVIPLLVAAIKELKAEFDAYKASHP